MEKVGIIGVGYVGLTQAVGMAELGHSVIAYDIDAIKIAKLQGGESPFFEPGLDEVLIRSLKNNLISFSTNIEDLANADFIFLCLPTPQGEDGSADTSHLLTAVNQIAPIIKSNVYLIIKSTVPVRSWLKVKKELSRDDVFVISNPEFLREGSALFDFHNPDRIVIGAESEKGSIAISKLYEGIKTKFVLTDNTSAELIKYAANSFLAIKLSFVNDIAALCEKLGGSSEDVLYGVGLDERIGNKFLTPGPGWGGSCFPKDVRALANIAENEQLMMPLLKSAIESNENAHERIVQKILKHFGNLKGIKIGVLGLAFKANTDDIRNSPAIEIIRKLQNLQARILAHDPAVSFVSGIDTTKDLEEVFERAELLLILTEWEQFANLNFNKYIMKMKSPNLLDTRSIVKLKNLNGININIL